MLPPNSRHPSRPHSINTSTKSIVALSSMDPSTLDCLYTANSGAASPTAANDSASSRHHRQSNTHTLFSSITYAHTILLIGLPIYHRPNTSPSPLLTNCFTKERTFSTGISGTGLSSLDAESLTISSIAAKSWPILDEDEGDWRSQSAVIAQSIQLIKHRTQWKKITSKLEGLSVVLEKPGLWDDPVYARRVSREHVGIVNKMKEVNMFE